MTDRPVIWHELDGTRFRLAANDDLSFLQRYGRVFQAFDDHDSGNISFGIDAGDHRLFVKLAGARTIESSVTPQVAIANLRRAGQVYRDLDHPHIVRLLDQIEHGPYLGLVFAWNTGTLLRRVNHNDFARFRALPMPERLHAFAQVVEVFQHIHARGYMAIDIYDASLLYDFDIRRLTFCDLDLCQRLPMVNTMGRMWGSSRFMSPEEYELDATIDEITNVFTLGAIAHLFFGDERSKRLDDWDAGVNLYRVAETALQPQRADRYQRIADFALAWQAAAEQPVIEHGAGV